MSTKPGLPPGEEERYREFLARQRRLREEEQRRKAAEPVFEEPPLERADARRRAALARRRRRQALGTVVFAAVVAFIALVVWWRRPVIGSPEPDPVQIDFAEQAGLPLEFTNSIGMRLRLIPPGTFVMGSPADESGHRRDEEQREIGLPDPFYIGVTEVTQGQYEEIMGTNPSFFEGDPDLPVEYVTWYEAIRFCNELSRREGLSFAYGDDGDGWGCRTDRAGYRLPLETEWEYACRAGTLDALYTGPLVPEAVGKRSLWRAAWYHRNSGGQTRPVGQREPNRWGLYDMLGNVAEYCWDVYRLQDMDIPAGYVGPPPTEGRVTRGGGWFSEPRRCRCAARRRWDPALPWNSGGFRVVRSVTPEGEVME